MTVFSRNRVTDVINITDRYLSKQTFKHLEKNGADEVSRTPDLLITNQLLYQLSYIGIFKDGSASIRNGGQV